MKTLIKLCSILLLFFSISCAVEKEETVKKPFLIKMPYVEKDPVFLNKYQDIVYGYKNKEQNKARKYTRLWRDSLKIYFANTVPSEIANNLMRFTDSISKDLDSLNIKRVNKIEDANYTVYFIQDSTSVNFEPKAGYSKANYYIHWKRSTINKGYLMLNEKDITSSKEQLLQLRMNFFKSLGFFDYLKKLPCSDYLRNCRFSNYNYRLKKYSVFDQEVLDYHYSYGICMGIDRKTFEDYHAGIQRVKDTTQYITRFFVTHQY